jgi:hypothetical protein
MRTVAGKTEWGVSGREGYRDRESRLMEWETEHRRELKWHGLRNDCWK